MSYQLFVYSKTPFFKSEAYCLSGLTNDSVVSASSLIRDILGLAVFAQYVTSGISWITPAGRVFFIWSGHRYIQLFSACVLRLAYL